MSVRLNEIKNHKLPNLNKRCEDSSSNFEKKVRNLINFILLCVQEGMSKKEIK